MANFNLYFPKLAKAEGGYSNDIHDRGGETYFGISRKNFPTWSGWKIIDQEKTKKSIKAGTKFPNLEAPIKAFYKKTFWDSLQSDQIVNQSVAEILVDWKINGGFQPTTLQKMLGVAQDGKIGKNTISVLNLWEMLLK
jgi:lysozyme family protein